MFEKGIRRSEICGERRALNVKNMNQSMLFEAKFVFARNLKFVIDDLC